MTIPCASESNVVAEASSLNVSIVPLSEVRDDNDKFRIDDGFFSQAPVRAHRTIEALPHVRLGDVSAVFRKGIFDICAVTYADEGIPFVPCGAARSVDQRFVLLWVHHLDAHVDDPPRREVLALFPFRRLRDEVLECVVDDI